MEAKKSSSNFLQMDDTATNEELLSDRLNCVVGIQEDQTDFSLDFADIPHMLICGCTGAGKTTFVQKFIIDLTKNYGKKVAFAIYDSKSVDYNDFDILPNVILKAAGDNNEIITRFISKLSNIIEERRNILNFKQVNSIENFNKNNEQPLSHIFVILDDFSNLNLDKDILKNMIQLLSIGRIVGVHYVIVTSIASNKTLPKDFLFNVTCRIAFRVSSKAESKLIIDCYGAEKLNFPGEFILKFNNWQKTLLSYELDARTINKTIKNIKRGCLYDELTLGALADMAVGIFAEGASSPKRILDISSDIADDPLYDEVLNYVIETQKASTSLLQRRFGIGYNRAARLIDILEEKGMIGPALGSKPREVWINNKGRITKPKTTVNKLKEENIKKEDNIKSDDISLPSFVSKKDSTPDTKNDSEEDLPLRDFEKYKFGMYSVCVKNNLIYLELPFHIIGSIEPSFGGKGITKLTFKKPTRISKGYICFNFSREVQITNDNPELLKADHDNITELLTLNFTYMQAEKLEQFIKQLSEDIKIPVTYL